MSAYLGSSAWLMADASRWVLATFIMTTVQGIMGIPTTIKPNVYSFLIGKNHAVE